MQPDLPLPTRQEIVDEIEALEREQGAAYTAERERIGRARAVVQSSCGRQGHVFRKARLFGLDAARLCVFCEAAEP